MDWYVVVERPRTFFVSDRRWKPRCGTTGCTRWATHEVKLGPRLVDRRCEEHAHEECERLNHELADARIWASQAE